MEHSFQNFHFNTCLVSMGFVAVSTLFKTHFHVFPPTPTWNLYLPTWNFFNTHPNGTPTFHLEHPPQVQTAVVKWKFKLTFLHLEFKFFHPVDPNFSFPAPYLPQNQKHKTKLLPRYNQLSSIKFDQTYQLEMLKTLLKTTRVEISTPS